MNLSFWDYIDIALGLVLLYVLLRYQHSRSTNLSAR